MSDGLIDKHRKADGKIDGLGVMADLTKRPLADMETLWAEVKANQAKLNACPLHEFGPPSGAGVLNRERTCTRCGGWAAANVVRWYELGLAHAKGQP